MTPPFPPIQDWVLIWCTFPGGEITFLCRRLGDLLVCAAERQGRHASFPGEGSPPTEPKNGDGGGCLKGFNWGGKIWGLLFLWDSAISSFGMAHLQLRAQGTGDVGETKKVGMWGLDAFFLPENELSPYVERAHLRLTSGGREWLEEDETSFFRARSHQYWMKYWWKQEK